MMRDFMDHIYAMVDANPADWRQVLRDTMARAMGLAAQMGEDVPGGDAQGQGAQEAVDQTMRLAEELVERRNRGEGGNVDLDELEDDEAEGMPGAFPQ